MGSTPAASPSLSKQPCLRAPSARPAQAVILAGGRGERLRPLTDSVPKPMIAFHGRPFLEYLLESLRDQGIRRVLLLLGYKAETIVDHFGDGAKFGLEVAYSISNVADETGTRLRNAKVQIEDPFLLAYCDNYWPLDLAAMTATFDAQDSLAMLTVYRNRDHYTRDNVRVDSNGTIVVYDKTRTAPDLAGVDIGFAIMRPEILDLVPAGGNPSFEATVYPQLVAAGRLTAFETSHRYYSVGSLDRLPITEHFLARERTVLVDRDGTINERMPVAEYVTSWDRWQWLPGAREALARLTAAGYRIVIITNQPGVARGALTSAELAAIHDRMCSEASVAGARIDAVLACEHGWDEGCDCRKPKPGLLFEAQRRFALDLSRVPLLGDDPRDGAAAQAAGSPFIEVSAEAPLAAAVDALLKGESSFAKTS
jgi:histidinol-phosphate phosphatase family protein